MRNLAYSELNVVSGGEGEISYKRAFNSFCLGLWGALQIGTAAFYRQNGIMPEIPALCMFLGGMYCLASGYLKLLERSSKNLASVGVSASSSPWFDDEKSSWGALCGRIRSLERSKSR